MGFVDDEKGSLFVGGICPELNVPDSALVARACDDDRIRPLGNLRDRLCVLRIGVDVGQGKLPEVSGVVDGHVAAPLNVNAASLGCCGRNCHKNRAGGAVHGEPGLPSAPEICRTIHLCLQDFLRVVEIVEAVNFRDVKGIDSGGMILCER